MKLEEYEHIMRTGTPSDRARAIAAASNDKELSGSQLYGAGLAGRPAGGRHQHPLQDRERDDGRSAPPDGGDWGTVTDRKQCIHVFEITRPGCLACAGRDEKCREYKRNEEKQNESHDRA